MKIILKIVIIIIIIIIIMIMKIVFFETAVLTINSFQLIEPFNSTF